jgi:RNA polymerase sigma factor (sigma-70 family)
VPADVHFAGLCDASLKRSYGLAGYLLSDPTEAEDATQEAMARAWQSRRSLRDPAAFDAWLDRILVNVCRDRMRRRQVVRFIELDSGREQEARNPFGAFLDRDELGTALRALTPDQRIVVVLRFWRDLSLEQIAERVGWPLGTVKSRLHHAISDMRRQLERDAERGLREVVK